MSRNYRKSWRTVAAGIFLLFVLLAGIVDWDRFKAVQVEFSYGTGAQSAHTSLTLNAGQQADPGVESGLTAEKPSGQGQQAEAERGGKFGV